SIYRFFQLPVPTQHFHHAHRQSSLEFVENEEATHATIYFTPYQSDTLLAMIWVVGRELKK
ncbi:hypothetical protein PMAYCL1PPCAC_11247, partial [Pristionchus mayeri]